MKINYEDVLSLFGKAGITIVLPSWHSLHLSNIFSTLL